MNTLWINMPADLILTDAVPVSGDWKEEVNQAARGTWSDLFPDFVFELVRIERKADVIEYILLCGVPVADGGIEYKGCSGTKIRPATEHDALKRKRLVCEWFKGLDLARKRSET